MIVSFEDTDALLLVDVQNDFLPGGALPVAHGDEIIPVLNGWIDLASAAGIPVIASRDWHPSDHISFRAQGGPWPEHCVQHTDGARFAPDLRLPDSALVVSKASSALRDAYSAFDGTGLTEILREQNIRRLWVGGLALDYCVKASMLDALDAGFSVHLIPGGTRGIEDSSSEKAIKAMLAAGAKLPEDFA